MYVSGLNRLAHDNIVSLSFQKDSYTITSLAIPAGRPTNLCNLCARSIGISRHDLDPSLAWLPSSISSVPVHTVVPGFVHQIVLSAAALIQTQLLRFCHH